MVSQALCCVPASAGVGMVESDGRGVEQNLRAAERRQARAFGIPLVPADQRRDARIARVEAAEAQIARREIILLVEPRIVGDVHLAVQPEQLAAGIDDHRRIVIHARHAPLEHATRRSPRSTRAASLMKLSVVGPGMGSARSNVARSSVWQKYCERKSSWTQIICAPLPAASRIRHSALARFSLGSSEQAIWIRPTRNLDCFTRPL